jgi:hypothetical protein
VIWLPSQVKFHDCTETDTPSDRFSSAGIVANRFRPLAGQHRVCHTSIRAVQLRRTGLLCSAT